MSIFMLYKFTPSDQEIPFKEVYDGRRQTWSNRAETSSHNNMFRRAVQRERVFLQQNSLHGKHIFLPRYLRGWSGRVTLQAGRYNEPESWSKLISIWRLSLLIHAGFQRDFDSFPSVWPLLHSLLQRDDEQRRHSGHPPQPLRSAHHLHHPRGGRNVLDQPRRLAGWLIHGDIWGSFQLLHWWEGRILWPKYSLMIGNKIFLPVHFTDWDLSERGEGRGGVVQTLGQSWLFQMHPSNIPGGNSAGEIQLSFGLVGRVFPRRIQGVHGGRYGGDY